MPRKDQLKPAVAPQAAEPVLREPVYNFTLEERVELKRLIESPLFRRAWRNAKLAEPSAFPPGDLNGLQGGVIANNRLHQQQGWKMFEAALLRQVNDPVSKPTRTPENYPDSAASIVTVPPQPPPPK